MTLMEFTLIPLDKGSSFSKYVAKTLKIVQESGLDYRLGPMGTVVEGEWEKLITLLTSCFKSLDEVSDRISLSVKFDHRKGYNGRLDGKVKAVAEKLSEPLKTS